MDVDRQGENSRHSALMDAVYRNQRHIYDLTRKYYLLGRDHLLGELDCNEDASILEIACGTGRNLIVASRYYPKSTLFGLDISEEMLKTAQQKMATRRLGERVNLKQGDATDFDTQDLFGQDGFDRVILSYAVSMIPGWDKAIGQAMKAARPGGEVHIVDFGQQERLPGWFGRALHTWLAKFHVEPRAELEATIARVAARHGAHCECHSLYRDYARYGVIYKPLERTGQD